MRRKPPNRRGTTCVEFAVTVPIVLFLILFIMVGAMAVFRYQQVAALAREGARWASVHGAQFEKETGNLAASGDDIYREAILPMTMAMNRDRLDYEVTWQRSNIPLEVDNDVQNPFGNTVTVTINYDWMPEFYLVGPIRLSSRSTAQMIY